MFNTWILGILNHHVEALPSAKQSVDDTSNHLRAGPPLLLWVSKTQGQDINIERATELE